MNPIVGKTLVFTDQHFGIKNNSQSRHKIAVMAIKAILEHVKKDNVKNIVFMGDYFHSRSLISSDTINIAYKCMQALAKMCRTILVVGNHDLFMKNSVDITSMNMFQDIPNVEIVSKPTSTTINSKTCLLVPWLSELSPYSKDSFDFLFGHFDVSSKFLVQSYVEEHTQQNSASDKLKSKLGNISTKTGDSVGSFVELAKKDGTVFAGHIHQHKEFKSHGRTFIFVGSPYQQTLGDIGYDTGFYVIDEDGKYKFYAIGSVPKHVQILVSDVLKDGIDKYDFSCVSNNIVQKVYDIDISLDDDQAISKMVMQAKPYEELLPEYQVQIEQTSHSGDESNAIELIKKSKLEYIKNYVSTLDQAKLDEDGLDKDKIFDVLKQYYEKVAT